MPKELTGCLKHLSFSDLKNCKTCRAEYKMIFDQWLATQEITENV